MSCLGHIPHLIFSEYEVGLLVDRMPLCLRTYCTANMCNRLCRSVHSHSSLLLYTKRINAL